MKPLLQANLESKVSDELRIKASLEIYPGESLIVMGPSGSGKTTLLKLLSLLRIPDRGYIAFQGERVFNGESSIPIGKLIRYRRRAPLITQIPTLIPDTVEANLLLPFDLKTSSKAKLLARAKELLKEFGFPSIDSLLLKDATKLSVGEAQRVCIVRALLLDPSLIMLDEPTANLDEGSKGKVLGKLSELMREGISLIIVTHDQEVLRYIPSSKVFQLKGGELLETS